MLFGGPCGTHNVCVSFACTVGLWSVLGIGTYGSVCWLGSGTRRTERGESSRRE